jgi:carbamoylphosphate synthase large subunit
LQNNEKPKEKQFLKNLRISVSEDITAVMGGDNIQYAILSHENSNM